MILVSIAMMTFLIGFFGLFMWSKYNVKRYGHLNRRQSGIGLVDKNTAYPEEIMKLRYSSHVLVYVDKSGKIHSLKALDQ